MKMLFLASIFISILVIVYGDECPLCNEGNTDDWTCTCSGGKLKDDCGGAGQGIGAVLCIVPQYCCIPKFNKCIIA
ncbi:CLUMA_CG013069, isoform A [Clunio marinus]|uniref:CLUMA_CG013069, isoform A n=1 Tax=Clunio marinus TaxID=568069 RepID=A0A1J1IMS0_9DIPT|nr:CLUMA_CG013069, isoform A [Clunio marinus]